MAKWLLLVLGVLLLIGGLVALAIWGIPKLTSRGMTPTPEPPTRLAETALATQTIATRPKVSAGLFTPPQTAVHFP